jgi:hypothetical protein
MAVQLGDLAIALGTILWIKQNCFGDFSQADRKYRELKGRIEDFERALMKLEDVGDRIVGPSYVPGPLPSPSQAPYSLDIGDYQSTLNDCKDFLRKHAHIEARGTNPLQNGIWTKNRDPEAQSLRDRINEHYQSALLLIGLSSLDSRSQTATPPRRFDSIPPVPQAWGQRFRDSLLFDDSINVKTIEEIPLDETMETIHDHIIKTEPPVASRLSLLPDHSSFATQYLHLLKAQYLFETVQSSNAFQHERSNSRNRQYAERVAHKLIEKHKLLEIQPSDEDLLAQWHKDQSMWRKHTTIGSDTNRHSTSFPASLEKNVLQIDLANQGMYVKDELSISRISDDALRLQRRRVYNTTNSTDTKEMVFRQHEDKLIPWYVLNAKAGLSINKLASGDGEEFHLKSRGDKLRLQAAFTGYDVCRPKEPFVEVNFSVTIAKTLGVRKQEYGNGEIQLWNWPTPPSSSSTPTSPMSSYASSVMSVPTVAATAITQGMNSSIFTYQGDESGTSAVISGKLPPPPLLVAFTRRKDTYSLWRVDCECSVSKLTNYANER